MKTKLFVMLILLFAGMLTYSAANAAPHGRYPYRYHHVHHHHYHGHYHHNYGHRFEHGHPGGHYHHYGR